MSPPVAVLSPSRMRFSPAWPFILKDTSIRAGARPYCARSAGFSSTTRSMSSVDRPLVIDESSVESASAGAGSTSFQASPVFVTRAGFSSFSAMRTSSMRSEATEPKAFSLVVSVPVELSPSAK